MDGHFGQNFRLVAVGGDKRREGEQLPAEGAHSVRGDEVRAGGGYHHGVYDDVLRLVEAEALGDGLDEWG